MTTVVRRRTPAHRHELGEFLRACRSRLTPAQVGMPPGGPRRTPGLRREEVAVLAGVGVTWYTWLEQGRDIKPSDDVLAAIARTLRLTDAEAGHLFALARDSAAPSPAPAPVEVPPALRALVDGQDPAPAMLMDRRWDLLAWNRAAELLWGFGAVPVAERNVAWFMFVDAGLRATLVDWPRHARRVVGELYAGSADLIGDARFTAVVARLRRDHPEVEGWWSSHEVHPRRGVVKEFRDPRVGTLHLEEVVLHPAMAPDLQLSVMLPRAGTDAADRLRALVDGPDRR